MKIPLRNRKGSIVAYTLIDEIDSSLSEYAWCLHKEGYAIRRCNSKIVLLHRVILGLQSNRTGRSLSSLDGEHKNRNKLDNRRKNLRRATRSQNSANKIRSKSNTSGYKGVFRAVRGRKTYWYSKIMVRGKLYNLGYYSSKESAAKAYDKAAKRYCGPFAVTNRLLGLLGG